MQPNLVGSLVLFHEVATTSTLVLVSGSWNPMDAFPHGPTQLDDVSFLMFPTEVLATATSNPGSRFSLSRFLPKLSFQLPDIG